MRYIFSEENKNYSVRIIHQEKQDDYITKIILEDDFKKTKMSFFIRNLAGDVFISQNRISWEKATLLPLKSPFIYINKALEIFRGFIPSGKQGNAGGALKTQMPGVVVKVMVTEGQVVKEGEALLILEAMKMENEMKSPKNGIIKKIYIKEGMNLESGFLMMEIEGES